MRDLEILLKMIDLNNTLIEAFDYVKQNGETDPNINTILADMKKAFESIYSNALLVFDNKRTSEIQQYSWRFLKNCDSLITSKKAIGSFIKTTDEWRTYSAMCFYMKAISIANTCSNDDKLAIDALELVSASTQEPQIKSQANFVLSRKLCYLQPLQAYHIGMEAFELDNSLCANITPSNSPVHNYVYNKVKDIYFEECPICHENTGFPYYCAAPMFMINFTSLFNPIKLWMKCKTCGQLYAYNFPEKLIMAQPDAEEIGDEIYMKPRPNALPVFGKILKRVLAYSNGNTLLEVGAGSGELIATALELGCDVEAIEISKRQSQRIMNLLGIDVHCADFIKFDSDKRFDMITMGDVIEHITDPTAAIKKAHGLLNNEGILWLSTPNFESGFSRIMKFDDAMWNEPWHITYFSYNGIRKLLKENGFEILDYEVSERYSGSMEIIAKKV